MNLPSRPKARGTDETVWEVSAVWATSGDFNSGPTKIKKPRTNSGLWFCQHAKPASAYAVSTTWPRPVLLPRVCERLVTSELKKLASASTASKSDVNLTLTEFSLSQWDWKLVVSTPERALLELLDELPARETFHQVDMLMQGLTSLSPRRLKTLLEDCKSVKVKRLFFFFADRHAPSWLKALKKDDFDLGTGKRLLVKGGKFIRPIRSPCQRI
jgi:hypothetical protein